jgi:hypothetical protein
MYPISTLIPLPLRTKLIEAAKIMDDEKRRQAIDDATTAIRTVHPNLFKPK